MRTELLPADAPGAIDRAVELLRQGELVAFPTDTVYGVGAPAFVPATVGRLFSAKIRPADRPIALLVAPEDDLRRIAARVPPDAARLGARFWPGGLTLIVERAPDVSDAVTAGGATVGIRVPDHPVALALIRRLAQPVAATSANLSGGQSPLTAQDVLAQLDGRISLVLDGGRCPGGVESTVLDLTTDPPTIRRLGAVSKADLEAALGREIAA